MILFWTNGSTAHPPFCQDITAPPPTHTHFLLQLPARGVRMKDASSYRSADRVKWRKAIHHPHPLHVSHFLCPVPTLIHTHQRYWYVCAFQSSPHCCEHGYWTSAIKYNQSRYCNRYARPKRSFQIYDFFSCIFRLEFSCVVYSHEYMHILTIDRLVCKENCRSWWLVLSVEWMRKFCYFGITLPFLV